MKAILKYLVAIVILSNISFGKLSAQSTASVTITTASEKSNVWVSNFPKNASVIIVDSDNNLLSIVSTNEFGAAYIKLNKEIKTAIIVKTMNGEVLVSNKAVIKQEQPSTALLSKTVEGVKA